MKVTGRKNLQKGEAVIYTPETHWIVVLRPLLTLCVTLALYVAKWTFEAECSADPLTLAVIDRAVWIILIINVNVTALYFLWQLVEFYRIEYRVTNKRLIVKRGVLKTTLIDMPVPQIESVRCEKGLAGKIFGYGRVSVRGTGGRDIVFAAVSKPFGLRRVINTIIEYNKKITITREEPPARPR